MRGFIRIYSIYVHGVFLRFLLMQSCLKHPDLCLPPLQLFLDFHRVVLLLCVGFRAGYRVRFRANLLLGFTVYLVCHSLVQPESITTKKYFAVSQVFCPLHFQAWKVVALPSGGQAFHCLPFLDPPLSLGGDRWQEYFYGSEASENDSWRLLLYCGGTREALCYQGLN